MARPVRCRRPTPPHSRGAVSKRRGGADGKLDAATLVLVADLAGIFVIATGGATAAMRSNLGVLGLMVLAFATALCGGVVRGDLLAQIPAVLRVDIYATVVLAGSLVMIAGHRLGVPRTTPAILGGNTRSPKC
jgi:uncharacterized membrane protein YeiH